MIEEINSTHTQLIGAFKKHHKFSQVEPEHISHYLLLFYAVECGLKAKYLKENGGNSTKDFETLPISKRHGYGHDIVEWQKLLRIPNFGYSDDSDERPIKQMHERLRYGAFNLSQKEKSQIKFLKDLATELKKQF